MDKDQPAHLKGPAGTETPRTCQFSMYQTNRNTYYRQRPNIVALQEFKKKTSPSWGRGHCAHSSGSLAVHRDHTGTPEGQCRYSSRPPSREGCVASWTSGPFRGNGSPGGAELRGPGPGPGHGSVPNGSHVGATWAERAKGTNRRSGRSRPPRPSRTSGSHGGHGLWRLRRWLRNEPLHDADDEPVHDAPAGCRHSGYAWWHSWCPQHCATERGHAKHDSCDGDSESIDVNGATATSPADCSDHASYDHASNCRIGRRACRRT